MQLRGVITDKLLKLLSKDDPAWTPQRDATPAKKHKNPKGVEGHQLGGRRGRGDGKKR
jgi:hypothetical protein